MRLSIERIDVGCLGEHVVGDAQAALVAAAQVERAAEQIELVGLDAGSRALGERLQLTRQQVQPQRLGNSARRSEERRVGKACASTCGSRGSPAHEQKNTLTTPSIS